MQVVTEEMLSRELAVAFPLENLNKDAEIAANTFKLEASLKLQYPYRTNIQNPPSIRTSFQTYVKVTK